MTVFVLVHSPFVGPLTWYATARALEQKGHVAVVPTLGRVEPPGLPQYANVIADATQSLRAHAPLVLVAHSAAGLVIPAARAALQDHRIQSYIFVDAAIPREGVSLVDLIPASLGIGIEQIRAQATAGLLPPWGTGWPEETWRRLIPDASLRAQFIAESGPTPLALYEERVSWPPVAWPDAPCKYSEILRALRRCRARRQTVWVGNARDRQRSSAHACATDRGGRMSDRLGVTGDGRIMTLANVARGRRERDHPAGEERVSGSRLRKRPPEQ